MTLHERFSSRRCPTAQALEARANRTLDTLPKGEPSTILGFAPGESVVRLRRAPLGGPVMFRVGGVEIVLRSAEARRVVVAA